MQEEVQETAVDSRGNVSARCLVRTAARCSLGLLWDQPSALEELEQRVLGETNCLLTALACISDRRSLSVVGPGVSF